MQAPEMAGVAAQRYAGGDPKFERHGGVLEKSNNTDIADWQLLGANDVAERLRVARLRRRFGLNIEMATLLARVAFETMEAR